MPSNTMINNNIPNIIPIRDGYEFRGWRDGNSIYQPKGIIPVSNNVVLKAIWEINTYNVTLYANGGTFSGYSDEWVSRTYNHNEEINREDLVDEPIRNGYEFLGWSENHEATEQQYEKDIKINRISLNYNFIDDFKQLLALSCRFYASSHYLCTKAKKHEGKRITF